jgi:hypothetical protein
MSIHARLSLLLLFAAPVALAAQAGAARDIVVLLPSHYMAQFIRNVSLVPIPPLWGHPAGSVIEAERGTIM